MIAHRLPIIAFSVSLFLGIALALPAEGVNPRANEPLVDVAKVCPGVRIELRYATRNNVTGHPIYPSNARCLVRLSVAARLRHAQRLLREHGAALKIWDAYRPASAQRFLWQFAGNREFVGDPARGGSLHTWGVAVDATLVTRLGADLRMPTGFDDFSPAAARKYVGKDPAVARHLSLLQTAMTRAGFKVMRDEWWHFVAEDYLDFAAVEVPLAP